MLLNTIAKDGGKETVLDTAERAIREKDYPTLASAITETCALVPENRFLADSLMVMADHLPKSVFAYRNINAEAYRAVARFSSHKETKIRAIKQLGRVARFIAQASVQNEIARELFERKESPTTPAPQSVRPPPSPKESARFIQQHMGCLNG